MIQSLINKHFFNLLLFTLTFGILLYDAIGFDYTDEICALFLFVLFGIYLFSTSDWNFNKGFLTTIGVFLFYFCYSLYIGSNTKTAIISDMLIQIKPYLAFFCVYSMMPRFSESQKNIMKSICLVFWFLLLLMGLGKAVEPRILFHLMGHPAGTSRLYGKHSCCDTRIACKAGIGAKYALNKTWVLQSALEFVSIGGKDDMDYVKNAKMNELYLQIPVRVAARLPLGKDYHASLNAGPYIACGVGGKTSGSIPYYHDTGSSDGNRLFKIDTFGNVLENNAGNRRLDGGIIVGIAFEYRRLIIGAEAQVGLVKINQQLRQVIDTEEFHNYLPRNFASFFTVGYKFR